MSKTGEEINSVLNNLIDLKTEENQSLSVVIEDGMYIAKDTSPKFSINGNTKEVLVAE